MGLLNSVKGEVKQRIDESKESKKLIRNEQKRIEEKRAKAKKSVVRKIKPVDAISSKVEVKHDERVIAKLEQEEAERLAAERRDRTRKLAHSNRKPLAIIAIVVIALIICGLGIGTLTKNARLEKQYNEAVQCIIDEDYLKARELLTDVELHDSDSLIQYAIVMSKAEAYKDSPDVLLRDLNAVGQIENEAIKEQHDNAVNQVSMLVDIKKDIESIDLLNLSNDSKTILDTIGNDISKVDKKWIGLINTDSYDQIKVLVDNIVSGTDIGNLYLDIQNLGETTLESGGLINKLLDIYNELSSNDKELIFNYEVLSSAQKEYEKLEKEAEEKAKKEAEEKAKKEEEQRKLQEQLDYQQSIKKDGYNLLQSFFISIDEKIYINELKRRVELCGLSISIDDTNPRFITCRVTSDETSDNISFHYDAFYEDKPNMEHVYYNYFDKGKDGYYYYSIEFSPDGNMNGDRYCVVKGTEGIYAVDPTIQFKDPYGAFEHLYSLYED